MNMGRGAVKRLQQPSIRRRLIETIVPAVDVLHRRHGELVGVNFVQCGDGDGVEQAAERGMIAAGVSAYAADLAEEKCRKGSGLPGGVQRYSVCASAPWSRRKA